MTTIIALYLTAQARIVDALDREEGQTSMEWLGIGAVVVAIAIALVAQSETIGAAVQGVFTRLLEGIQFG